MSLMAGARNRRLKTSPDGESIGDAVRVCEGSSSGQAPLRIALVEPQPVTRNYKAACHAIVESQKTCHNRAGDESPGLDCPVGQSKIPE